VTGDKDTLIKHTVPAVVHGTRVGQKADSDIVASIFRTAGLHFNALPV